MRYYVHNESDHRITVDVDSKNQLGKGATAIVYKAEYDSKVVAAKIYHPNKRVNELKISAMLSNSPDDIQISFAGANYPQIAWPFAILRDGAGKAAGYLMPLVDLHDSFSLDYFYDQVLFKKMNAPDEVALSYKLEIAKNLSVIVASLHKNKHYFIDLKPQNIRVFRQTHIVSLVDCDGFSIANKQSKENSRFPAELMSTDYISPEAFRNKTSPSDLGESQDRYALAVILFQLLNNGTHPFQGILFDDEGFATNDEKAAAGLYPHSTQPNLNIKPRPQSIHFLWDDKTRELFDFAFVGKLDERPSAEEWARHFETLLLEKSLIRCDKEPLNIAHMRFKGKECHACYLNGLRAFKPTRKQSDLKPQSISKIKVNSKSVADSKLFLHLIFVFILIFLFILFLAANPSSIPSSSNEPEATEDVSEAIKLYRNLPNEALEKVISGWNNMDPNLSQHDYKIAFDNNLKAYQLGSPEGASNLALLYENGWGVPKDLNLAFEWYKKCIEMKPAHSSQAELGLARIYMNNPIQENLAKAEDFAKRAKELASEPIWISSRDQFLRDADKILEQIKVHRNEMIPNKQKNDSLESSSSKVEIDLKNILTLKDQKISDGWGYMDPTKFSHDYKKAYELNMEGYRLGHFEGASNIGMLYENGWGLKRDQIKALEWFQIAANSSNYDHSAQAELGVARTFIKQGKDAKEVSFWINKARTVAALPKSKWADSKYTYLSQAEALELESTLIDLHNTVKTFENEKKQLDEAKSAVRKNDFDKAFKILEPLSKQDNPDAQLLLAHLYANGYGVEKNPNEEFRLNKLAAEKGNSKAQFNLGQIYSEGRGVTQNHSEAIKWYRKAAEQDLSMAQLYLAIKYIKGEGVTKTDSEAFKWFKLAADKGNSQAQHNVGVFYEEGLGDVSVNLNEAADWYKKAAVQGDGDSQYSLGLLYWSGKGIGQSDVKSYQWLTLSQDSGYRLASLAQKARDTLANKMSASQIDQALSLVQQCKKTKLVECE